MPSDKTIIQVYRLRVKLAHDKRTYRDILIRGNQTFETLHKIIYQAFDREEEHLYCFTIKKIMARGEELKKLMRSLGARVLNKRRYETIEISCPECAKDKRYNANEVLNAAKTKIQKINLELKQKFEYLFDFGDEWRHEIQVMEFLPIEKDKQYPQIVKINGVSPEQYLDCDEDE